MKNLPEGNQVLTRILLFSLTCFQLAAAQQNVRTIFVVREAERTSAAADAPLSPAGQERAGCLAQTFKDSGIKQIFVTETKATQATASPLANALNLKATIIPARDTSNLVRNLSYGGTGNVVVVAQSETLPVIIARLQGGSAKVGEKEYDRLFVIPVIEGAGTQAATLRYCPVQTGRAEPREGARPKAHSGTAPKK